MPVCRLCAGTTVLFYEADRPFSAKYYHCPQCDLVQLDEKSILDGEEEAAQYNLHQNDKKEPGYVEFLGRCLDPTIKYLAPGMSGLDFGCGPYPMLAELMSERGFPMDHYDPYFYPDATKLKRSYDFVTATEVIEHFNEPAIAWKELTAKARKGGIISVMTSLRYERVDFPGWHYRRDATHVSFYSPATMEWIAKAFDLEVLEMPKNVAIYRKN